MGKKCAKRERGFRGALKGVSTAFEGRAKDRCPAIMAEQKTYNGHTNETNEMAEIGGQEGEIRAGLGGSKRDEG